MLHISLFNIMYFVKLYIPIINAIILFLKIISAFYKNCFKSLFLCYLADLKALNMSVKTCQLMLKFWIYEICLPQKFICWHEDYTKKNKTFLDWIYKKILKVLILTKKTFPLQKKKKNIIDRYLVIWSDLG